MFTASQSYRLIVTLNRVLFFRCGHGYHVCDKIQKFQSLLKPLIVVASYRTLSVLTQICVSRDVAIVRFLPAHQPQKTFVITKTFRSHYDCLHQLQSNTVQRADHVSKHCQCKHNWSRSEENWKEDGRSICDTQDQTGDEPWCRSEQKQNLEFHSLTPVWRSGFSVCFSRCTCALAIVLSCVM